MITLRRAADRYHVQRHRREEWLTFDPDDAGDPFNGGFGDLEMFSEGLLPPGAVMPPHARHDVELVSYVLEGALTHEDATGGSSIVHAGEFQRRFAGRGIHHRDSNSSRTRWAHVFQLSLRPSAARLEQSHDHRRFSAGQRRGALCVVASPDGRRGSLRIHEDVVIHSALLDVGQHVIHPLFGGRSAWLHIVSGSASLIDVVLTAGDGAGVTAEPAVSLTARAATEILLVDLNRSTSPR